MIERWRKSRLMLPAIAAAVAAALLVSLGTWQLQRRAWKEGLLADIAARGAKAPVDIDSGVARAALSGLLPFTRVTVRGRFQHENERYWFADGRLGSGYHVFTPLVMSPNDDDRQAPIVWVNRGYVPARLRDPATRAAGNSTEVTAVSGIVRAPGERNQFTPANDVEKNVWFWRDLPALNASAGFGAERRVATVMIDAEALPANPGGWPEGGTALVNLPNRHLEYALTWYALAATLIGVFLVFARGRLARSRE